MPGRHIGPAVGDDDPARGVGVGDRPDHGGLLSLREVEHDQPGASLAGDVGQVADEYEIDRIAGHVEPGLAVQVGLVFDTLRRCRSGQGEQDGQDDRRGGGKT